MRILIICVWIILSGMVACTTEAIPTMTTTPSSTPSLLATYTPIATVVLSSPTERPTQTMEPTSTLEPTSTEATVATQIIPTDSPTQVSIAVQTAVPTAIPATSTPIIRQVDHYVLRRPIARDANLVDWIDRTYPYGGTQFGTREVHLGVEFVNPRFTPVLAAAAGVVAFAGNDDERLIGPDLKYYGNVVLIEHNLQTASGMPVFTLYAHLQRIKVQVGDTVADGDEIGNVGDSGIAIGPHLHFEVRVGDAFDYRTTRNPELWIRPYPQFGTLAGQVVNNNGELVERLTLLIRSTGINRETYTYGSDRVNGSESWQENYTLGDLPVGEYELVISNENGRIRHRQNFSIENGATTFLSIVLDDVP